MGISPPGLAAGASDRREKSLAKWPLSAYRAVWVVRGPEWSFCDEIHV